MKTILVTGSSGFLGSHICESFLKKNYRVIGLDNFSTGLISNTSYLQNLLPDLFQFIQTDICLDWDFAKAVLPEWLSSLQFVFHFASPASPLQYQKLPLETLWANSLGLAKSIEFADKFNAKVIFASSSEVYGDPDVAPQNESYWGNVNPFGERSCYDEAKRFGEALIFSHNKKFRTHHGLVRIFNTYGPRMHPSDGRVIINFIIQALQNRPITIYGDGTQTRSFCYVDDLIAGIEKYALSNFSIPMNLGDDKEISILELARLVKETLNSHSEIIHSDLPIDDPKKRCPDLSFARSNLYEWNHQVTLAQGILKMALTLK